MGGGVVGRVVGVVDKQHSSAVLFATAKGAYDISLKNPSFFAFVVYPLSLPASCQRRVVLTHLFPIAGELGGGG